MTTAPTQLNEFGHNPDDSAPFFSIVLPTRNRPDLFRRALDSVLSQSCADYEILVVNDGSEDAFAADYQAIQQQVTAPITWLSLPQRGKGHGPSFAINTGAAAASGRYLCFLDDDDSWELADHLQLARAAISEADADAFYSNQAAYTADNTRVNKPLWLEGLLPKLPSLAGGPQGTYKVSNNELLENGGFPHLNCTILRRDLFLAMGGMDEGIRYECEVDLYLRTLTAATSILYNPAFIGRHNVPVTSLQANVSTGVSTVDKRLSQVRVYEKSLATSDDTAVIKACKLRLASLYKHLAEHQFNNTRYQVAAVFARQALACQYSLKWRLYCFYVALHAAVRS